MVVNSSNIMFQQPPKNGELSMKDNDYRNFLVRKKIQILWKKYLFAERYHLWWRVKRIKSEMKMLEDEIADTPPKKD